MHQLVYVSTARAGRGEDDLKDILSRARETNQELCITGILVHLDGYFLQVLEGEQDRVRNLYARIENEPHHSSVKVLLESDVAKRAFPDWSMGFREASRDDPFTAGFVALMRRALEGRISRPEAQVLLTIVKTFYRAGEAAGDSVEREPIQSVA